MFVARTGQNHEQIKNYIEAEFGYRLDTPLDEIRKTYTCSMFPARRASRRPSGRSSSPPTSEDAVRRAISLEAIATRLPAWPGRSPRSRDGGIPMPIERQVFKILDESLGRTTREFVRRFPHP